MPQHRDHNFSVWVLTPQRRILKVDSEGRVEEKSPSNFASDISFNIDHSLWIVPKNGESLDNQVQYSENEGQSWTRVDLPDLNILKISSTHVGSCFILTAQGSIYLVQKSGDINLIFDEGTANDIAVSPEGFIWIILRQKKPGGGNIVYWCAIDNYVLQPAYGQPVAKKIAAGPGGAARIITIGGEVASLFLERMGGLETPGGEVFAKDIAASCSSNTIWTISSESFKKKKRNVLKFWNPDFDPYMAWDTVSGVEPHQIVGGD